MADEQIQQPEEPDDKTVKEKAESESNKPGEKDEIADNLKSRIEASKRNRKQFYNEWKRNVELRLGRIASQYTGGVSVQDEVQTEVNPDWFLTKTKTANLFSKVPQVQGTHENKQFAPAVPPFLKALNYELGDKRVDIGTALEEELNDVVNAAGVGAILLGWMARFEMKSVPDPEFIKKVPRLSQLPPEIIQQLAQTGKIPMAEVPHPVNGRFYAKRVSPVELLWPAEFSGSNLNDADFAGHSGRLPEGIAKGELNLTDEELKKVLGNDDVPSDDTLRSQPDKGGLHAARVVKYDEIFYWRHRVDPECKYFDEIWRLVYVDGIDKAKIHEPYKGQQLNEQTGEYIGVRKYPIQFLTLTYISDNPVPPSDSSAGRPQVNDMRRSRSQMFQQRERSIPVRWYNVNGIDPLVADTLMRGTWQGMIPTNGDGSRFIGEIARASYPSEDLSFDAQNKKDLMELWQISPEQLGVPGGRQNKEQTQAAQAGFSTRMGQERGRVASHFLNICEVLAGLMVMFGTFPNLTEQEKTQMTQAWDLKHVVADLVLKILPDSTIMLDTSQRIERLLKFLNMTVKSGFINPKPIIVELAELSGLDPTEIVVDPKPKEPEEPNISMRFTGKEDLMNPMVVAMLKKRAPSQEELAQAKQLLESLSATPQVPGAPVAPGQPGSQGPPPPGPGRPPGPPHLPGVGGAGAHPEWSLADKVAKRSRDMAGGA